MMCSGLAAIAFLALLLAGASRGDEVEFLLEQETGTVTNATVVTKPTREVPAEQGDEPLNLIGRLKQGIGSIVQATEAPEHTRKVPSGLAAAAAHDNAIDFSIPAIFLVTISALTLASVMTLAVVIICYNRMATSKGGTSTSATTIADVSEQSSAWDSLSFNHSRHDLNNLNNEMWESNSDESYLNSLDEVVSQRASIIHPHTRYVDTVSGRISHCRSSSHCRNSIPSVFTESTSVDETEFDRKSAASP